MTIKDEISFLKKKQSLKKKAALMTRKNEKETGDKASLIIRWTCQLSRA